MGFGVEEGGATGGKHVSLCVAAGHGRLQRDQHRVYI